MENGQEGEKRQLRRNRCRDPGRFQLYLPEMERAAQQFQISRLRATIPAAGEPESPSPPEGQATPELTLWDSSSCEAGPSRLFEALERLENG